MGIAIWSGFIWLVQTLARLFSFISPKLNALLAKRNLDRLPHIEQRRSDQEYRVLFFCSSAGEYEQAKPLMNELVAKAKAKILIVFFSESGSRFAGKRGESIPYILAPFDSFWNWQKVFRWFCPDDVIVVRHEIWPGFIHCAKKMAKRVYLINASLKRGGNFLSWRYDKKILLTYFDTIFLVDPKQVFLFTKYLAVKKERLIVTGDTKFDRVFERFFDSEQKVAHLRERFFAIFSYQARLMVGSAWPKDYEMALSAFSLSKAKGKSIVLIIAPHEVDTSSLRSLQSCLKKFGQEWQLLSELLAGADYQPQKVLVVDLVGFLAELYCLANLAFVGGSMHHKVHNVLEPAIYGLSVAFGPHYKSSAEAIKLLEQKVVALVENPASLCEFMEQEEKSGYALGANVKKALEFERGASARICRYLLAN